MTNTLIDALLGHGPDDAPFLITEDGEVRSYGALRAAVSGRAEALAEIGVRPGDRVLCQMAKDPEGLLLYLATVAAGAVFVPLNPAYTSAEVDYFLGDAAPALMILDDSTADAEEVAAARSVPVMRAPQLARDGTGRPAPRAPDDLAAILYTSGTTGRSKGAMLSHDNLLSNALVLKDAWRFTATDCLLHALPIFHTHGLFVATNIALAAGASMRFLPRFDLDAVAAAMPACTSMMGVPTFYTRMLADPRFDRATLAHMRVIISGSAPLLDETHRAFEEKTGHAILERYGMTETNMITTNPYEGDRRAGTVGHPLPGVDLRLADQDENGIGVIETRGPNVTQGYWQNPEKTAESFSEDDWFITGDLGQIDENGYVSIVGRQKDLVISGGYNVYPKEVEQVLDALPGVLESAVYGAPHPDLGEAVVASVVLTEPGAATKDALLGALKENLARFKIPREIEFLDALPRNAMGKVQKAELRKQAAQPR